MEKIEVCDMVRQKTPYAKKDTFVIVKSTTTGISASEAQLHENTSQPSGNPVETSRETVHFATFSELDSVLHQMQNHTH